MGRRSTALSGGPGRALLAPCPFLHGEQEVVVETIYVLESFYETPREQIAQVVRSLLAFRAIVVVDRDVLLRAVEVYETNRLDSAEASLVACAESAGAGRIASFGGSIGRVHTVERVEPST